MSLGGNESSSNQQATSQTSLDPQIKAALLGNYAGAQNTASTAKYTPLSGSLIGQYENPYQSDVTNSTMAALNEQNQEQNSQNGVSAAASGDYNSDRLGVQNAETNRLYSQTAAQTLAQLNSANYTQATNTAQTQNTAQNNWPLVLQQLLNQSLGLAGNPVLGSSQSTGSSQGAGFSFAAPVPA